MEEEEEETGGEQEPVEEEETEELEQTEELEEEEQESLKESSKEKVLGSTTSTLKDEIEISNNDVRQLNDYIGVQHERLFSAVIKANTNSLPDIEHTLLERDSLLEKLENPSLIELLKQSFNRAEKGAFSPRPFQNVVRYIELLKHECPKFEVYINLLNDAVSNIETYFNSEEENASKNLSNYKEILLSRILKLLLIKLLVEKYVIKESCADSYIFDIDKRDAHALIRDQTEYISKLKNYILHQRKYINTTDDVFGEFPDINKENEIVDKTLAEKKNFISKLDAEYNEAPDDPKNSNLMRFIRTELQTALSAQSSYIKKLKRCLDSQAKLVPKRAKITDKDVLDREGYYIAQCVEEWLLLNWFEIHFETAKDSEIALLSRAEQELQDFCKELNEEIEKNGNQEEGKEVEEEEGEEEEGEEEEGEQEGDLPETVLEWLRDKNAKKEFWEGILGEMKNQIELIRKEIDLLELEVRLLPTSKEKKRDVPKISHRKMVLSDNLPDNLPELKEFCKDLVKKYECLNSVYFLAMNVNEEKRRMEKMRLELNKYIDSKIARKKGIQFEMQLKAAYATIADLKQKLKENKKNAIMVKTKATKRVECLQEKLEEALSKQADLENTITCAANAEQTQQK